MIAEAPRSLKVVVYLACIAGSFWLGRWAGSWLGERFFPVLGAALAAMLCAVPEERFIWSGWFRSSPGALRWIGRTHNSRLTSHAPAPVALGMALGLLSVLA